MALVFSCSVVELVLVAIVPVNVPILYVTVLVKALDFLSILIIALSPIYGLLQATSLALGIVGNVKLPLAVPLQPQLGKLIVAEPLALPVPSELWDTHPLVVTETDSPVVGLAQPALW